jgi:hypothetical protein
VTNIISIVLKHKYNDFYKQKKENSN